MAAIPIHKVLKKPIINHSIKSKTENPPWNSSVLRIVQGAEGEVTIMGSCTDYRKKMGSIIHPISLSCTMKGWRHSWVMIDASQVSQAARPNTPNSVRVMKRKRSKRRCRRWVGRIGSVWGRHARRLQLKIAIFTYYGLSASYAANTVFKISCNYTSKPLSRILKTC